jgi:hypothetical protein
MNHRIVIAIALVSSSALPLRAQMLPNVTSGALVAQFRVDAATVGVGGMGEVTSWAATNDPTLVLTSVGDAALNIRYGPTRMNGRPTITFTDAQGDQQLEGMLPAAVDLSAATVFWLGYYSIDDDNLGRYVYSIGTSVGSGATQLTHQRDNSSNFFRVEIYDGSSTFGGDRTDMLEEQYRVWRTVYRAGSVNPKHSAFVDGIDLNVASNTGGYNVAPDPHPIFIGGWESNGFNFYGELAELLVYSGELDSTDVAAIEAYLDQRRNGQLGTPYCMANVNASGDVALCRASGSNAIGDNDVVLGCLLATNNANGYFITSRMQGFVPNPGGSRGNLCITGAIGRYATAVFNTTTAGGANRRIDLRTMPSPTGSVAVQAGETWYFQAWFRDTFGAMATSNFTDGYAVTFQ